MALQADEKDSLYPSQAPPVPAFTLLPAQVLTVQERNRWGRASSAAGRLEVRPQEERSIRIHPRNPLLRHSRLCFPPELNFLLSSYYTRPQTAPHPVALHSPNNRSSICLHPSFISFLFPFSSALPLRPLGSLHLVGGRGGGDGQCCEVGRPPRGASKGSGWGQGSEAQGLPPPSTPPTPPQCS